MNKRMYLGILIVTIFATSNNQIVKAIEPISLAVGALVTVGVSKAVDGLIYLFGPSKSAVEYETRHGDLQRFSKRDFAIAMDAAQQTDLKSEQEILSQHELYRYENFIATIKEKCPNYANYIKALMQELNDNPKARLVRGFETDHVYHKAAAFFKKRAKDFSAFYRLIQKLYAEVLAQEQQAAAQKVIEQTLTASAPSEPKDAANE